MRFDSLILGAGYVGSAYRRYLMTCAPHQGVCVTHQRPLNPSLHIREFSLENKKTWLNLPESASVLWTFPPAIPGVELEASYELLNVLKSKSDKIFILGSTSAYIPSYPGAWVDENSTLNLSLDRVQAEEILRENGASIVSLSGIHGPGRDPIGWVKAGRIKNFNALINLIHVSDICYCLNELSKHDLKHQRIICSNGHPELWSKLIARIEQHESLHLQFTPRTDELPADTKQVSNKKLQGFLPVGYNFTICNGSENPC